MSPVAALWLVVVGLVGNASLAASPLLARAPVLLAVAVGTTEVAVPAVAIESGQPAATGVLLALFSVGSLAGGLAAASLPTQPPPVRQLRACATACALSMVLLSAAASSGVARTGVVVLVAGATIAPALAALYAMVERVVDPVRRTEAFALVVSAFLAGIAGGSAGAGWLAEHASPAAALLAAAPLPLLAALACQRSMNGSVA